MLSKKLLTAIKKAAGKKGLHSLTNTFHIIEKDGNKWVFASDSAKLFAVMLPEEYNLSLGVYSIDALLELEKYTSNNEVLKPLDKNDTHYMTSPDFWQIIPKEDTEQSLFSDIKFNAKYFTEMIDFISVACNYKIPTFENIKVYTGKPAVYQASNIIALLMPMRK